MQVLFPDWLSNQAVYSGLHLQSDLYNAQTHTFFCLLILHAGISRTTNWQGYQKVYWMLPPNSKSCMSVIVECVTESLWAGNLCFVGNGIYANIYTYIYINPTSIVPTM